MDYSFRLLFAFVSMRRSRQAHFSFCGFFSTAHTYMYTTRWHISNKRNTNQQIGNCWRIKKFQRPELQLALKGKWAWLANREDKKRRGSPSSHEQEGSRVLCQVLGTRFQPPKKRNRFQRVCTRSQYWTWTLLTASLAIGIDTICFLF